jgi:hypothetical protein
MNLILKKRLESRLQPIVPDWSQNNNSILSSYTHKKSPGIRANKTAKLNFKPSWALLLTFGCPQFVYQSLCIRASNNWHYMKNKNWSSLLLNETLCHSSFLNVFPKLFILEPHNGTNKWYRLVYNGGIIAGQKWWETVLEIEISCSQWEASACTQSALIFFIFPLFPTCLYQVLIMFSRFPMCSPMVFSIAPHFPPICFAQSPPLSHLYTWAKGGGTPSFHRIFQSFNLFLWYTNQIGSLQKQKVGLVAHPKLINMKQKIVLEKDSNLDIAPIV